MRFQPLGERARWRVVYDLFAGAATGEVVTYKQLGTALGLDPEADRHSIQMAVRRAAREHEEADNRAVDVIPNAGYMIVRAHEHLRLARQHQKRASKALARGESKVVHVDLAGLDPATRQAFEVVAIAFRAQIDVIRRLDIRHARLEDAVSAMTQRTERTEQELGAIKERLARLEQDT